MRAILQLSSTHKVLDVAESLTFNNLSRTHSRNFPAGTYNGHEGAVWTLDVNFSSTLLLTGSADTTARLWDVQTGRQLFKFEHSAPVRGVNFAEGDQQFLTVGDKSLGQDPMIYVWNLASDVSRRTS